MKNDKMVQNEFWFYLSSVVLTLIALSLFLGPSALDLSIPGLYSNDSLFTGVAIKTIIESGWYLHNAFLGAPAVYNLADYPLADNLNFLIIKILTLFSHNYAVILNVFYYLTFPLIALISLFAFRKLQLDKPFALTASILFTFLPYHLMRGENHLFLSAYFSIPIYVLLIFLIFNNSSLDFKKIIIMSIATIIAASSGVYYAYFACYFLIIAGLVTSFSQQNWCPLLKSFLIIAIIAITVVANVAPTLLYHSEQGKNTEVAHRTPNESEDAALKISQLLLPVDGHRVKLFKRLKNKYNSSALLINENRSATLGVLGSIGFLLLLSVLLIKNQNTFKNTLFNLSCLNISAVLLGTMGGFSSLIAYTVFPTIRAYNRISVFIAFFALCAFFLALQMVLKKIKLNTRYSYLLAGFLLLVGLYDQVGYGLRPQFAVIKEEFRQDTDFVQKIEEKLPRNAMIFQLPVTNFPENAVVYHMGDYELFKGYLHAKQLRWSYGAIRGRGVFGWQKDVAQLPVKEMVNALVAKGFKGIYINREGFNDNAKDLEGSLVSLLKQKPLENGNQKVIFFELSL